LAMLSNTTYVNAPNFFLKLTLTYDWLGSRCEWIMF
jgi:hypothetical protein